MTETSTPAVLVLDFGSQYTQLIARRIRELQVYCEIVRHDTPAADLAARAPLGLVLSGGPASAVGPDAPEPDPGLLDLGVPVLGICYGMQLAAEALGGRVEAAERREYGPARVRVVHPGQLLDAFEPGEPVDVWMSHGDRVVEPPPGAAVLAATEAAPVAAFEDAARGVWGVQFHPEVAHTPRGTEMLRSFVHGICGAEPTWTPASFVAQAVEAIRAQVADGRVVCGLSGGVDSAVAAALLHRAVGEQLTAVFVDNGLCRRGEAEEVVATFREALGLPLVAVDASERFLSALAGVEDPEEKRRHIGREFIAVFEEEARRFPGVRFLGQGTLYPDVIESVSAFGGPSATIKSHHNVGGLPERMDLELVEPLRFLFKDEVRRIGAELGLPGDVLGRHPFPGPGLAVRILGEVTRERLDTLRAADAILQEEVRAAPGLYEELWQVFAVLLPVRTVGVMGDARTYEAVAAVRAVTSLDGMTADWAPLPWEVLGRVSSRVINEVPGINRVVYDVSSKPPATIEWE